MKTITVEYNEFRSWYDPITVTIRTEDGDIEDCNHAGATDEVFENTSWDPVKDTTVEWENTFSVCDKCKKIYVDEAWRVEV